MLCSFLLALGLNFGCVEPAPPHDAAASVLKEQEQKEDAEVAAALAKRARLYEGLGQCRDCGAVNVDPFPKKE